MINLQGVITPILDLRIKFNLKSVIYDELTVVIVVNIGKRVVGVVVDSVSDALALDRTQISPVPELGSATNTGFITGIGSEKWASVHLDDPSLSPIFQSAQALGAPILIHPRVPVAAVRAAYYSGFRPEVDAAFATYGLGWHYDAGIQFLRLVLAGTFDRMPGLQVILGHWGEVVLFYAERLAAMDKVSGLAQPIASYLRKNLYVTARGMFLPHYLERAAAVVGVDRLLFSTDFPYQYRGGLDARRFLENCGLTEQDKAGFAHRNWMQLTGEK